jgi:methylthioribulose-1-phosphate dehydratase
MFIPAPEYKIRQQLTDIIRFFHQRGWSPATSTNYSFRTPEVEESIYTISKSGIDKQFFHEQDFMHIDRAGKATADYAGIKPSAETLLHTLLYDQYTACHAILHTHSVLSTVLSAQFEAQKGFFIANLEVLKAIRGISTHATKVWIPIFKNSQDMTALSAEIKTYLVQNPETYGFLLSGHGLYAWGTSLAEAKRHIEAFEFLFECFDKLQDKLQ